MMKRVRTILGYAIATAFCGFLALVVSHLICESDCAEGGEYVPLVDKITYVMLGILFFCSVFAFTVVYNRYKLYKSFYDSMLRRIEKLKIL
jgi:hypothetical protein